MEDSELFTERNFRFFSIHKNTETGKMTVGSLYFRAKAPGKNVVRGRIRLVHDDGPQIENEQVINWVLKVDGRAVVDLVENTSGIPAVSREIEEEYTSGTGNWEHLSRGLFEFKDGQHALSDGLITDLVNKIREILSKYENSNDPDKWVRANTELRNFINQSKFPDWIHQPMI